MLLSTKITIHTVHKNLTFDNLLTQCVLRWWCYVEEYSPTIKYIKGPLNVIADTFSCMGRLEDLATISVEKSPDKNSSTIKYEKFYSLFDDADIADCLLNLPDEECYLNLPNNTAAESPLDMHTISEEQLDDEKLIARVRLLADTNWT